MYTVNSNTIHCRIFYEIKFRLYLYYLNLSPRELCKRRLFQIDFTRVIFTVGEYTAIEQIKPIQLSTNLYVMIIPFITLQRENGTAKDR